MTFQAAYDPFRALGGAWNLAARAPGTLAVGALLLFLLESFSVSLSIDETGVILLTLVSACCCFGLAFWLASCLVQIGLAAAVEAAARGERAPLRILFEPRGRFLALLLARLGKWLAWMAASLPFGVMIGAPIALGEALDLEALGIVAGVLGGLLYLPLWAWLVLGLVLVEEAVVFEGREPVAAIQRSWALARGNRLRLLVFALVMLVLTLGGCCLCLVGVLVTGPWARLAWFESFQRLSGPAPQT